MASLPSFLEEVLVPDFDKQAALSRAALKRDQDRERERERRERGRDPHRYYRPTPSSNGSTFPDTCNVPPAAGASQMELENPLAEAENPLANPRVSATSRLGAITATATSVLPGATNLDLACTGLLAGDGGAGKAAARIASSRSLRVQ